MNLLLLLLSCAATTSAEAPTCVLEAPVATPDYGAPGDSVSLATAPLTDTWDTVVTVGAARAAVTYIVRSDCDGCDTCMSEQGCVPCGACDACADACATCAESVTVVVPDLAAGSWPLRIVNRHGSTGEGAALTVTASTPDTGEDSGGADSGDSG